MFIVSPPQKYQVKRDITPLDCIVLEPSATGTNQIAIPAISGTIIRVMGLDVQAASATAGGIAFKDGNAGTVKFKHYTPANTSPAYLLPVTDSGYFETAPGNALYMDVLSQTFLANVFFITYLPIF